MIRKPIITLLGHVDAGKSSLLDRIRGTDVVAKEPGGITQHIGATEVPLKIIEKISGDLLKKYKFEPKIPGLLFIDTPGHEAFVTLRTRGGSIADLAVLVVDVNVGLQNQSYEAIEILKQYKTPFIVAANKIDRICGWRSSQTSFSESVKLQAESAVQELDNKIYQIVGQLHGQGFNSERFDRCEDFTRQIPIVPICARTGEGIPEILMLLAGLSQKYMTKRLNINEIGCGKGTVLEVTEDKGLGKTINVILYDGMLKVGDEIVVGGKKGIIRTKIRALLEPKPLSEIRACSTEKFKSIKEVHAAAGVKIAAPGLDDAIAGAQLRVIKGANEENEILEDICKVRFESDIIGPIVKADTLGALEAFVKLLETRGLKVRCADVGEVARREVIEMESVKEKDSKKAVIFAFNVKVNEEAQKEAEKSGVKIFCGNIIYKLLEDYDEWANEEKERQKKKRLAEIIIPCKFQVLEGHIFHNAKPAIVGVKILEGRLRAGVKIIKENGKNLGELNAIQSEGKELEIAEKGKEVAVSIAKAIVGRNLFENDVLYTFIPKKEIEKIEEYKDVLTEEELALAIQISKIEQEVEE